MRVRAPHPSRGDRSALPDVVAEHLEELGYLAIQERRLRFSPEFGPAALDRLSARMAAHHEGVRLAGPCGVEIAEARTRLADPFQRAVALRVWLAEGRPAAHAVLAHLHDASPEQAPSCREALRRAPRQVVADVLPTAAAGELGRALATAVDAWAWHGLLPADRLRSLATAPAAAVRAALARGLARAGEAPDQLVDGVLGALTCDPDPSVARRALWSAVLRAPADARARCRQALASWGDDAFAVQALGLVGTSADFERLAALARSAPLPTRLAALRALGALGDVRAVEPCLDALAAERGEVGRAAGDALEAILGVLPRGADAGEDDALVAPTPPDATLARTLWERHRAVVDGRRRWARGRPLDAPHHGDAHPMVTLWQLAVAGHAVGPPGLRHEVPDGFWDAAPAIEARAGE